ncbi:zinc-binding dehydrogenase [Cedecea colo]|uniref:Zn-dependent alcohol dehydrogenase n=1 Tax=Cedecea colo TaxID=2552946 RepID=A0ABX0VPD4_9ENTR|nr:zinc-binding dehydrogenase [Cedecea colo]NIY48812.1 Zn-dependent alcohol dehydrogenase [Cedecea colo]
MKAMRFVEIGAPLQLQEVPIPTAQPGWVVIRVEAAGICHTDNHILAGAQFASSNGASLASTPPLTLGHEVAGVITEIGSDVEGWYVGDRVVSGPMPPGLTLGAPGNTVDGGFAEYCAIPAQRLMPIPDGLPFEVAAVATDAINTSYSAVKVAGQVTSGLKVGIVGLGGLGLSGLATACYLGAQTYGVDVNPGTFASARRIGARECFTTIAELGKVQPDVIVDFAGAGTTSYEAALALGFGGRLVIVGMETKSASLDTYDLILGEKTVVGSHGGSPGTLSEVFTALQDGYLAPNVTEVPLTELNDALDRLKSRTSNGQRYFTRPGFNGTGDDSAQAPSAKGGVAP